MKAKALTLSRVVASLTSPNESVLPELLPLADREVDGLIDDGLADEAIVTRADRVAGARDAKFVQRNAALTAFLVSGDRPDVTDAIEGVLIETRDAAFALGLAAGLRIGGAR